MFCFGAIYGKGFLNSTKKNIPLQSTTSLFPQLRFYASCIRGVKKKYALENRNTLTSYRVHQLPFLIHMLSEKRSVDGKHVQHVFTATAPVPSTPSSSTAVASFMFRFRRTRAMQQISTLSRYRAAVSVFDRYLLNSVPFCASAKYRADEQGGHSASSESGSTTK